MRPPRSTPLPVLQPATGSGLAGPLLARLLLGGLLLAAPLLGSAPLVAQPTFTDVTVAAGVSGFTYYSPTGHSLGANWIDFDLDGWPDLFVVGGEGGRPPHLFRNEGDGTFSRVDGLLPTLPEVEMSGSRFADIDRDGDLDIFIYTDNEEWITASSNNPPDGPPNLLLENLWNDNGGGLVAGHPLFREVAAAAGVDDLADPPLGDLPAHRSKTASFFDYDRDGCIDLFVGQLVINDSGEEFNEDRLFRNRCDGTFEDVTASSGVNPGTDPDSYRSALASGGFHLDADPWPDLYVVNVSYSDPQPLLNDLIYRNQGPGPGGEVTFTEIAGTLPGVGDDAQAGMGIDVADVDLDGDWDVYITDIYDTVLDEPPLGNVLYLGDGTGGYSENQAVAAGVESVSSWGANFFDVDLDGWEDLFVSTISGLAGEDKRQLFINNGIDSQGQPSFTNVGRGALPESGNSRGSAVADYDRDGDLDLVIVNHNGPLQLLRNDTVTDGHWLAIELTGTGSSPDAIGALVEATTGKTVRRRQVKGGSSAHSQDALTVHFGLGAATVVDRLRVRWPTGDETVLLNVPADQYLSLAGPMVFRDGFESGNTARWLTP